MSAQQIDYTTPKIDNYSRPIYEQWRTYTAGIESPECYIDFGFYTMIAAALQRRVWIQRGINECYPNLFTLLAGHPSIGKSNVIKPLADLIKWHSKDDIRAGSQKEQDAADELRAINPTLVPEDFQIKQLFPTPADSSSLRALTNHLSGAISYVKTGLDKPKTYGHCSSAFFLSDLVSLFKSSNETSNISDFLLTGWDCGNYTHATYNNSTDIIMKCCVTMLAGVQPDVMADIFDNRLVKTGFLSRCILVYAANPRARSWDQSEPTAEMKEAYKTIRDWLLPLSKLYGPVTLSPEADAYMKEWHEKKRDVERINHNNRLDHYYGRKDMHIMKLAMAIHFAESLDKVIGLNEIQLAHAMLDAVEPVMHMSFGSNGKNPLSAIASNIVRWCKRTGAKTEIELLIDFADEVREIELKEILNTLCLTKKLIRVNDTEDGNKIKYKANV